MRGGNEAPFFAPRHSLIVRAQTHGHEGDRMIRLPPIFPVIGFALAFAAGPAMPASAGEGLVALKRLSATLANEAVAEAVAACAKNGYAVTAVIVTIDGVRQAVLRGDGAPVHTLDSAFAKAYTAASLAPVRKEDSTKAIFERVSKNPSTTTSLGSLPNVTFTPGGVTIMAGSEPIGGIGVGGAPGGNFDDDCARAALAKIKDRMN
jgi:uncharacterized protein GlcG (DUF336 family)